MSILVKVKDLSRLHAPRLRQRRTPQTKIDWPFPSEYCLKHIPGFMIGHLFAHFQSSTVFKEGTISTVAAERSMLRQLAKSSDMS
jgi:hypothetical protein